jgi:hypothetical protein
MSGEYWLLTGDFWLKAWEVKIYEVTLAIKHTFI